MTYDDPHEAIDGLPETPPHIQWTTEISGLTTQRDFIVIVHRDGLPVGWLPCETEEEAQWLANRLIGTHQKRSRTSG
jgi:hypothetical protein